MPHLGGHEIVRIIACMVVVNSRGYLARHIGDIAMKEVIVYKAVIQVEK
jgi:hypothetical protein